MNKNNDIKQMIENLNNKMDSLREDINKMKKVLKISDVADASFEPKSNCLCEETFDVYVGNNGDIDREYKRIFPNCIDTFFYKDSKGRERLDFILAKYGKNFYFTIIYEGKKYGWRLKLWKNSFKNKVVVNVKIDNPGPWCLENKVEQCMKESL